MKQQSSFSRMLTRAYRWSTGDILTILVPFGISLLVYFPFYAYNLANPDGFMWLEWFETQAWMMQTGRWGMFLIDPIKPYINTMPLPILCALFFYSVGGIVFTELFGVKNKLVKILAATCFVCCPMVPSTLTYPSEAYDFGAGFLLAVLSILVVFKCGKWYGKATGVLLLCLSISLRQENISYAAAAGMMGLFNMWYKKKVGFKDWLQKAAGLVIVGVLGTGLFYLIMKLVMYFGNVPMTDYAGANNISILYVIRSLPITVADTYRNFFDFFFGSGIMTNGYWIKGVNVCVFAFFAIVFFYGLVKEKNLAHCAVSVVCIALFPLACTLISVFLPDYRNVSLHMSSGLCLFVPFTALFFCDVQDVKVGKLTTILAGILMLCCIWNYSMTDQADAAVMKETKDVTISLANRVYANAEADAQYDKENMKFLLIGLPKTNAETLPFYKNASDYAKWGLFWDNPLYTSVGWQQIFNLYVDRSVSWGTWDDIDAVTATEAYSNMPVYPAPGSMQVIDGIYVVKAGN